MAGVQQLRDAAGAVCKEEKVPVELLRYLHAVLLLDCCKIDSLRRSVCSVEKSVHCNMPAALIAVAFSHRNEHLGNCITGGRVTSQ